MSQINIKVEDEVKAKSEALFKRLGLTMSAAITMFLHQAINQHGLPFAVRDAGYIASGSDVGDDFANHLREASRYAREHKERMSHAELFAGLQEIIDAGR